MNNDLYVYHTDGTLIQSKEFDYNVTHAIQDEDTLIMSYDNGTLATYDWNVDKMMDEMDDFGILRSINVSGNSVNQKDKLIVCGTASGDIIMLKQNTK